MVKTRHPMPEVFCGGRAGKHREPVPASPSMGRVGNAGTGPERNEGWGAVQPQVPNSGRRDESCDWSRWMIDECICETRDSLRSSVAPISFMVNSS